MGLVRFGSEFEVSVSPLALFGSGGQVGEALAKKHSCLIEFINWLVSSPICTE